MIENLFKSGSLLDIGCGTGEFLLEMKGHNWQVSGMETAPEARGQAVNHDLQIYDSLDQIEGQFDIITMWHVLEHVHRLDHLAQNIKRLLKEDGYLLLAVPNLCSFDAGYFGPYWVALDAPRHLYHFRPQDITRLLQQWQIKLVRVRSLLYYDSWYNALLSAKLKGKIKNRPEILSFFEALIIGKISFISGFLNGAKSASPVYIAKKGG